MIRPRPKISTFQEATSRSELCRDWRVVAYQCWEGNALVWRHLFNRRELAGASCVQAKLDEGDIAYVLYARLWDGSGRREGRGTRNLPREARKPAYGAPGGFVGVV